MKNLLKEIGGLPLIDDNWDESKYDWINALIVFNRKLIDNEVKLFLTIIVAPDYRNMSRSLIQVNLNNYIVQLAKKERKIQLNSKFDKTYKIILKSLITI